MRERQPLRRPLFEPGDPRRFDTINTGGPLNEHYWSQLKEGEASQSGVEVTHTKITGTEPSPIVPQEEPLEITLVDMSTFNETKHIPHIIGSQEPKPLP